MTFKRSYPSLSDLIPASKQGTKRICIVTPDLLGAVKNGGIGTACAYLAFALADAGHDTSILFCKAKEKESAEKPDNSWMEEYTKRGIATVNAAMLVDPDEAIFPQLPQLQMARVVYEWLKQQPEFDLVLFMEWQGAGFYAMHAKAAGLAFSNTALCVVIHSPGYWHSVYNAAPPANPVQTLIWHMERESIRMADAVISPSAYMLDWTGERLCCLPKYSFVQPNLLEWNQGFAHSDDTPVSEIVFFGRLELRKGMEQFCAALDRLAARGELPEKVTFLGKCGWLGSEHSALYIGRRARKWPGCEVSILAGKAHSEAVEYICGPGRMAVMPSIADNSPYTVYECLVAGVPFLARDVGGIHEFLPESERGEFLFGDNPSELAAKIDERLGRPPRRGTLVFDQAENARAWREGLPAIGELLKPRDYPREPFISVILAHYNRPEMLKQAVESLYAQEYDNFEVILVDDGSTCEDALALLKELEPRFLERGWRILREQNGYVGAARNRGAKVAKGDWLLFFDDDNTAMPQMLKVCAKAAARQKRGLIPLMFQIFEGDGSPEAENLAEVFLPTANALPYSMIQNALADATSLVSRKTFQAAGGFREDYGIGHEDFELYLRLALMGEPAVIIPEPVFWYRRNANQASMLQNTNALLNRMRSMRPFLELLPQQLAEAALMTFGMAGELNLYADPDISTWKVEAVDTRTEPDCVATMLEAARALASQGEEKLADQLLAALPAENQPVRSGLLCSRAGAAAKRGDIRAIERIAAEFEAQSQEQCEIAYLYESVLRNLPATEKRLRREIFQKLRVLERKNPLACLLLAREGAEAGDSGSALEHFMAALRLAETEYGKTRPDVASAVQGGAFVCCLQHFALHGAVDRTRWPERFQFGSFLEDFPHLAPELRERHKSDYKYSEDVIARQLIGSLLKLE